MDNLDWLITDPDWPHSPAEFEWPDLHSPLFAPSLPSTRPQSPATGPTRPQSPDPLDEDVFELTPPALNELMSNNNKRHMLGPGKFMLLPGHAGWRKVQPFEYDSGELVNRDPKRHCYKDEYSSKLAMCF